MFAIRNIEKGKIAKEEILKEYPNTNIGILELDLSSLDSIHSFVNKVKEKKIDIDIFYANAGVYHLPLSYTKDGFEMVMGTNCIGNYVLFNELYDYLRTLNHRVKYIFTTSLTSRTVKMNYNDFFMIKKYKKMKMYALSKLGTNQVYLYAINKCKNTNVLPLLMHPGITYTPLIKKAYKSKVFCMCANAFMVTIFHKVDKAALSSLYLASDNISTPTFVGPRGIYQSSGYPKIHKLYRSSYRDYQKTIEVIDELVKNKTAC